MTSTTVRRAGAVLVSAVLLSSLAVTSTASPATAKARCMGKPATVVGTSKGEVIEGTPKGDVIVARGGNDIVYGRGGNDIICGDAGNDRIRGGVGDDQLLGGPGRDRLWGDIGADRVMGAHARDYLLGGPGPDVIIGGPGRDWLVGSGGNDRLVGGAGQDTLWGYSGTDRCFQGPGTGPHDCEISPPVPPGDLAIAWSDLDGDHRYGLGDVLISRLFDTNGDGIPSAGDTIHMGRYPVDLRMTAFADWGVDSHEVTGVWYHGGPEASDLYWSPTHYSLYYVGVETKSGFHWWLEFAGGQYGEVDRATELVWAELYEGSRRGNLWGYGQDGIWISHGSPSQPETEVDRNGKRSLADKGFIDVVVYP